MKRNEMGFKQIITLERVWQHHGLPADYVPFTPGLPEFMRASNTLQTKLELVVAAINGNWVPDWTNTSQRKHYIWWNIIGGVVAGRGLTIVAVYFAGTNTGVGARLVFETEEKARHAAKYFKDLFEEYYFAFGIVPQAFKKINAIFIGQDGSEGYEYGKPYELRMQTRPSVVFEDKREVIYIEREDGTGAVEYERVETGFFDNWTKVEAK
jgi:hypothetical protein